jgi:hypothetical protein
MAVVYTNPIDVYRGSAPAFVVQATIVGGGTGRTFYLRFGRLGAVAQLQKLMTETNDTPTSVTLTVALTEAETTALLGDVVDFQVISTNPTEVLTEGKIKLKPILR